MKWGQFNVHLVSDGYLWLDGGAMFGVVPKTLWQRKSIPDEKNRIRLALNCLLIQTPEKNILVDTGCGFKYTDKELEIYQLDHSTDLVQELGKLEIAPGDIDIVINPQQATLGSILAHIRQGDVAKVHSLRRGAAEAIEAIAHGDSSSSEVVGRRIEDIELPAGANIGAIVRNNQVIIAHDDVVVEADDHVVLFLVDKKRIREVEKLFHAPLTFA